jgi:hypothetical protein
VDDDYDYDYDWHHVSDDHGGDAVADTDADADADADATRNEECEPNWKMMAEELIRTNLGMQQRLKEIYQQRYLEKQQYELELKKREQLLIHNSSLAVGLGLKSEFNRCKICNNLNDKIFQFCPRCGSSCVDLSLPVSLIPSSVSSSSSPSKEKIPEEKKRRKRRKKYVESINTEEKSDGELLTMQGVLNDGIWKPCEEQEYGWILKNYSASPFQAKLKLKRVVGSCEEIAICEEGILVNYEAKPYEELYVIAHARAPALRGKYRASWHLVNEEGRTVGPILEMKLVVNLTSEQEAQVRRMTIEMGFSNREEIVAALVATEWNITFATNLLLEQFGE